MGFPAGTGSFPIIELATPVSRALSFRVHVAVVEGLLIETGFRHARLQLFRALRNYLLG